MEHKNEDANLPLIFNSQEWYTSCSSIITPSRVLDCPIPRSNFYTSLRWPRAQAWTIWSNHGTINKDTAPLVWEETLSTNKKIKLYRYEGSFVDTHPSVKLYQIRNVSSMQVLYVDAI